MDSDARGRRGSRVEGVEGRRDQALRIVAGRSHDGRGEREPERKSLRRGKAGVVEGVGSDGDAMREKSSFARLNTEMASAIFDTTALFSTYTLLHSLPGENGL